MENVLKPKNIVKIALSIIALWLVAMSINATYSSYVDPEYYGDEDYEVFLAVDEANIVDETDYVDEDVPEEEVDLDTEEEVDLEADVDTEADVDPEEEIEADEDSEVAEILDVEDGIEELEADIEAFDDVWLQADMDAFTVLVGENRDVFARAYVLALVAESVIEATDTPQALRTTLESLVDDFDESEREFDAIMNEVYDFSITFAAAENRMVANTAYLEDLVEDFEDALPLDADEWTDEQLAEFNALVARIEALFLTPEEIATINQIMANTGGHPLFDILDYFLAEHDAAVEEFAAFMSLVEDLDGLNFDDVMALLEDFASELETFTGFLRNAMRLEESATASSYNNARDHLSFLDAFFAAAHGTRYTSRDDIVTITVDDCSFTLSIRDIYALRDEIRPALRDAVLAYDDAYVAFLEGASVEDTIAVLAGLSDEFDALIEQMEDLLGSTIDCEPINRRELEPTEPTRPGGGGQSGGGQGGGALPPMGLAESSTILAGAALAGLGVAALVVKRRKK